MGDSAFMNAAQVAQVHGGQRLEPSDSWPFMRNAYPMMVPEGQQQQQPSNSPMAPRVPFQNPQQTSMFSYMQQSGAPSAPASGPVVSPTASSGGQWPMASRLSISDDTAKLALFAGAALGSVLLLDVAARFFVNMASRKK